MRIAVCVKHVLYTGVPFEVDQQSCSASQKEPFPVYLVDPAGRCALEEAMLLKERAGSGEVIALTVGPAGASEALYHCLARGADKAVHLLHDATKPMDARSTASSLGSLIGDLHCDLVLCGTRSLDEGSCQVPAIMAELLGLPQVTGAVKLNVLSHEGKAEVWRKLEHGNRQIVECPIPAVIAVEPTLNEPRYVSVHARHRARKREIETVSVDLPGPTDAETPAPHAEVVRVVPPRPRPKKTTAPDTSMSASARLGFLMTGGVAEKQTDLIEGPADKVAVQLVDVFRDEGLLPEK